MNRRVLVLLLALAACGPTYVDTATEKPGNLPGEVTYRVTEAWRAAPPACIAVLPFTAEPVIEAAKVENIRRAFSAHLAPQGRRQIPVARVDFVLNSLSAAERADLALVGERLGCGALAQGRVTEASTQFLGVYSRVAAGAEVTIKRASDGELLWEGSHVAASHGGSVPLSPIGVALAVAEAVLNTGEEQHFRMADDLARHLVGSIPDDSIAVLDDPAAPPTPVHLVTAEAPKSDLDGFLAGLNGLPDDDRRARLRGAIKDRRFGALGQNALLNALIANEPARAEDYLLVGDARMESGDYNGALAAADRATVIDNGNANAHFLRGRALIKLGEYDRADKAIVASVALNGQDPATLNALGYLNGLRGNGERALAAYRMAIDADHGDGFAWYNTGVLLYNQGDETGAADAFYGAGLAYLKSGNYGQAGKALTDLEELAGHGLDLKHDIDTLKSALAALSNKGGPT